MKQAAPILSQLEGNGGAPGEDPLALLFGEAQALTPAEGDLRGIGPGALDPDLVVVQPVVAQKGVGIAGEVLPGQAAGVPDRHGERQGTAQVYDLYGAVQQLARGECDRIVARLLALFCSVGYRCFFPGAGPDIENARAAVSVVVHVVKIGLLPNKALLGCPVADRDIHGQAGIEVFVCIVGEVG